MAVAAADHAATAASAGGDSAVARGLGDGAGGQSVGGVSRRVGRRRRPSEHQSGGRGAGPQRDAALRHRTPDPRGPRLHGAVVQRQLREASLQVRRPRAALHQGAVLVGQQRLRPSCLLRHGIDSRRPHSGDGAAERRGHLPLQSGLQELSDAQLPDQPDCHSASEQAPNLRQLRKTNQLQRRGSSVRRC